MRETLFLFCASNSSNPQLKEISKYNYAKLSYELGYQDEALNSLPIFLEPIIQLRTTIRKRMTCWSQYWPIRIIMQMH